MSCMDCDRFQESPMTSFYRWKNANIEVRGCRQHLKEVFEALNNAQHNDSISISETSEEGKVHTDKG